MTRSRRTATLAVDDRARIPFAIIGVLLLVTSVLVVGALETRSPAETNVDPELAMDRTEAVSQTALRDAVERAAADAAREPVTRAANTDLGRVLADGDPATADSDEVFTRYVKLLLYLEAADRFDRAGQEIRDAETAASLPAVTDAAEAEAAIDAVTLEVGGDLPYGDAGGDDLPAGTVRVAIDGVALTVEEDGRTLGERTEELSVTAGTPLFELHDRTSEYDRRLNADFAETDEYEGFGDRFAARLFPLAWERGYAQAEGAPVSEVIANRHVETLANDAIFAIQRGTFGTDDYHSDDVLTRAYACTLARDANGVYDAPDGNGDGIEHVLERVDEDGFCEDAAYLYEEVDGDRSGAPDWRDLASRNDYLTETVRIDLDDVSSTVHGELADEDQLDEFIDRTYTVDVEADADVERSVVPTDVEDEPNTDLKSFEVEVIDRNRVIDVDEAGVERDFYELDVQFRGVFERGSTDAIVGYDVTLTVGGEHSPNHRVVRRGIDHDYTFGPATGDVLVDDNYRDVPELALEEVLAGVDDADRAAEQLEAHFEANHDSIVATDDVLDGDDFVDALTGNRNGWTVHPEPSDRERLRGWLTGELAALEEETSAVSITPERRDLFEADGPLDGLRSQLESDDEWVYSERTLAEGEYANVPGKVRAELYLEYMERLRERVEAADDRHEELVAEFDEELTDNTGVGVEPTMDFAVDQFDADPDPDAADSPSYPAGGSVEIVPEGEPTYLSLDRIERERVPAVGDPAHGFAPLSASNVDRYGIPFESAPADEVELRTAGEVLEAGNATDELVSDPDWDGGSADALERELERWIDRYATEAGAHGARPFDGIGQREVTAAIEAELDAIGPTERQAIELGEGEETLDRIAENVSREFTPPEGDDYDYALPSFRRHLEHSVRHGLDASLGDEGTVSSSAIAAHTADLGEAVRVELADAEADVLDERLERAADGSLADPSRTGTEGPWLESSPAASDFAPNRVPSGTSLSDVPMWDHLTVNVWHVDVRGEYARFTANAETGSPSPIRSTGYVREAGDVSIELDGEDERVGRTEPIRFETKLSVPIAVPSDGLGVGDRAGDPLACSTAYAETGPIDDERHIDACAGP